MSIFRTIAVAAVALLGSTAAEAQCSCRCVDGEMQPICPNAWDTPPVCPPAVCPIAPPAVAPLQAPVVPPPGTTQCAPQQVQNPRTGGYEWQTICR